MAKNEQTPPLVALNDAFNQILDRTARFVPAAFHIHSKDSHDWGAKVHADATKNDRSRFSGSSGAKIFLDELATAFKIVCITDHMKCGFACELATASLARNDILVLPGMEVNCIIPPASERVHLLVIFPPGKDTSFIDRIFTWDSKVPSEANRKGQEDFHLNKPLADWVKEIERHEGILVIAHIDEQQRGHRAQFRAMRDESVRMFLTDANGKTIEEQRQISAEYKNWVSTCGAHAVEIMNPEDKQHYIAFQNDDGKKTRIPCVIRSDAHCVEDFNRPERKTFIKVSKPSFHNVKEALRFFETRVKFKDDLRDVPSPRIVGIRLRSPSGKGFFSEAIIGFNENLNCLIGPRGCGKSTIAEALRYALGRNTSLSDVSQQGKDQVDYRDIAFGIQRANLIDTIIEVIYEVRKGERHVLSAAYDEKSEYNTEVLDLNGVGRPISKEALLNEYPVRIYSWSEVENLGRQPELQRQLLDRLVERLPEYTSKRDEIYKQLTNSRLQIIKKLSEVSSKMTEEKGLLKRYVEFKADFDRINTPTVAALFEELDSARLKHSVLTGLRDALQKLSDQLDESVSLDITTITESLLKDTSEGTLKWWETEILPRARLAELSGSFATLRGQAKTAIDERLTTLKSLIETEDSVVKEKESVLREKTQASAEETLLRGKRETSKKRCESAEAKREQYKIQFTELEKLLEARDALLKTLEEIQDTISGARAASRDQMVGKINQFQSIGHSVSITFNAGQDRRNVVEYMRERNFLSLAEFGQFKRSNFAERSCAMVPPTHLARAILTRDIAHLTKDGRALDAEGMLSSDDANKLILAFHPFSQDPDADVKVVDQEKLTKVMSLQELLWDDELRILLNDRPVDQLSPGQRSSAMLPLVALSESVPLIIDQPEDNLDNRMVGSTLTKILADLKEQRQIIVATHNPNIVVSGDAEQVVVLEATGARKAKVQAMGCIDDQDIIGLVVSIMEGGADAFKARERRYEHYLQK